MKDEGGRMKRIDAGIASLHPSSFRLHPCLFTGGPVRPRKAFTLVELLVVIGIIAVLIAVLMPALNRARMSADLVKCQANFRQVHAAISMYAGENKGVLPWEIGRASCRERV